MQNTKPKISIIVSTYNSEAWLEKVHTLMHSMLMSEIILYPTETIYALGVNAFDESAWLNLCKLKGRKASQTASWLVRDLDDIERLAVVGEEARCLAEDHLPGPLTLVLEAKPSVPPPCCAADNTVSFRISSDKVAQDLIANYMKKSNGVPLTCTSANVHGEQSQDDPDRILEQFADRKDMITAVIDDGVRNGEASTVVRCLGGKAEVLREGAIVLD